MYTDLQYTLIVFPLPSPLFCPLSPKVVGQLAQQMIGYNLATKQTPKEGVKVNKVMWMFLVISPALERTDSQEALFFDNILALFRECCVLEERPVDTDCHQNPAR